MKTSIISSFFFLHLVENFKVYEKSNKIKSSSPRSCLGKEEEILKIFSVVYTIMETQAVGFPISEEDLEISAALISAFSSEYCLGVSDPYIITQIMWEAYALGSISPGTKHYAKIHNITKNILNSARKSKHA